MVKLSKEDYKQISNDERTLGELSKTYGVNEKTIRRNLKTLGLKKKTRIGKYSRNIKNYCKCGKQVSRGSTRCISCSLRGRKSWNKGKKMPMISKENHYKWKLNKSGYRTIYLPKHPNSSKQGYVAEHRLIVEQKIGRHLTKEEVVHHIDEDKQNNKIENLMLFKTNSLHQKFHTKIRQFGMTGPRLLEMENRWNFP